MLASAVPLPVRRAAALAVSGRPAPSSSTVTTSERPSLRASTRTRPPAICGSRPWTIAFSTSGCKRQRRQAEPAQRRGHLDRVLEAVFHPDLDDPHVGVDQVDLVAERVPAVAEPRERRAQVLDERLEHRLRARRVGVHERDHVGQGVEQEVRLDLRLQQAQLRFAGRVLGGDLARLGAEELLEAGR